jgi:hypothetical protein
MTRLVFLTIDGIGRGCYSHNYCIVILTVSRRISGTEC